MIVIPGDAQIFVRRRFANSQVRRQPFLSRLVVSPSLERFAEGRVDGAADADFISARLLMHFAQAACLLVSDGDHLGPPGTHVVLVAKVRGDFLMRHFFPAGRVEVFEPARPGLAGFRLDGFVAHARFESFRACHSFSLLRNEINH